MGERLLVLIEGCPGAFYSYGKVARYLGRGLLEKGFNVAFLCGDQEHTIFLGSKKAKIYPNAIVMTPQGVLANSYTYYAKKLHPDYIITIGGPWADPLKNEMLTFNRDRASNQELRKVKLIGYFSFDWFFAPNMIKTHFLYPHVVTMPTEAERRYATIPQDRFVKVPHGVNGNIFNAEVEKQNLTFPSEPDLVVGSVMKNHGRKNWAVTAFVVSALNVWGIKAVIFPLTTAMSGSQNWWNLDNVMLGSFDFFPAVFGNRYQMPIARPNSSIEIAHGFSEKEQAKAMKIMDLHLLPTRGEGFSLAILESLALGIPNIATDNEVLREVFGKYRSVVFVKPANLWVWPQEGTFFYDPSFIDFTNTAIDVAEHIEEYKERAYKESKRVIRDYSWEKATRQMIRAIELSDKYDTTMFEEVNDYMAAGGKRWGL